MRRLLCKLIMFLVTVLVCQYFVSFFVPVDRRFFETELPKLEVVDDVFYLADSTALSNGNDKRLTYEMLDSMLPGRRVVGISRQANNPDLMLHYCQWLTVQGKEVDTVVVCLNLRAFSPQIDFHPSYQFELNKLCLRKCDSWLFRHFGRPMVILKCYDINPISPEEYASSPVYCGDQQVGVIDDYQDSDVPAFKGIFLMCYMKHIHKDDRKYISTIEIARILNAHDVGAVFVIVPYDHELGESLHGDLIGEIVESNINFIRNGVAAFGFDVIDLSRSLGSEHFDHSKGFDYEHLDDKGRLFVASRIRDEFE